MVIVEITKSQKFAELKISPAPNLPSFANLGSMSFPYQKVLLIGATSGIGEALATRLVENGTKVVISGRRKENLDKFVDKHGEDKVAAKPLDVMNIGQVS
jgi:NADPH:quinone reductase-like Zn-dependent oxidoreductase